MTTTPNAIRFWLATLLLTATAAFLYARSATETVGEHRPLANFPAHISNWSGTALPIPPETLGVLGRGDFLLREYRPNDNGAGVELFVAYFPSQRSGESIHSPKNCLPGSGWSPLEAAHATVAIPGRLTFVANRYVVAQGTDRRLVLYWYQSHGRTIASEYEAKFYLVADAVRYNRSDGALVRFTTPVAPEEKMEFAERRLLKFTALAVPEVDRFLAR
jgi:EpsI family protein